jgi:hypothetical protein
MKKFKELRIDVGSDAQAIKELDAIKRKCNIGFFTFSKEIEDMYQQDDRFLHILAKAPKNKKAIIIVFANEGKIKVINIVPREHGINTLTIDEYNIILDLFYSQIIVPCFNKKYNIIITGDNVEMEEIIPKSYESLIRFIDCAGKESPFSHPLDRKKWCDFICTLFSNNEYLSSGDLEQWLLEDKCRNSKLVDIIINKYEDATELLEYYDRNYN